MMKPQECCVLIPSLDPDEELPKYVQALRQAGFGLILVVDDGSKAEKQKFFEEIAGWDGCQVVHHEVNMGKGAALKTGFAWLREHTNLQGVVTADSDGQHTVPDTLKMVGELSDKEEVLLGSRDFSRNNPNVPPKSRFGNRLTSGVFKVLYGHWLPDTQTGLRAFPRGLLDFMGEVSGNRFEYETSMLIQCSRQKIPMRPIAIETIYVNENEGTHFDPIRDSARIYKLLLGNFVKFSSASLISWLVDIILFTLLKKWRALGGFWLKALDLFVRDGAQSAQVVNATILARICSASLNYQLNKKLVFQMKECKGALWRYIALAVAIMLASALGVGWLSDRFPGVNSTLFKIVVDTLLFFVNYRMQKAWVFPATKAKKGE